MTRSLPALLPEGSAAGDGRGGGLLPPNQERPPNPWRRKSCPPHPHFLLPPVPPLSDLTAFFFLSLSSFSFPLLVLPSSLPLLFLRQGEQKGSSPSFQRRKHTNPQQSEPNRSAHSRGHSDRRRASLTGERQPQWRKKGDGREGAPNRVVPLRQSLLQAAAAAAGPIPHWLCVSAATKGLLASPRLHPPALLLLSLLPLVRGGPGRAHLCPSALRPRTVELRS
mmetsp:Transcript_38498/g.75608  ORF Transcript_38498/g.75608 Transcript_38498/m.75608 type:complete len:223 (-) Transcript_38498:760-1428(-)